MRARHIVLVLCAALLPLGLASATGAQCTNWPVDSDPEGPDPAEEE
jgi:hypothetical protein